MKNGATERKEVMRGDESSGSRKLFVIILAIGAAITAIVLKLFVELALS